VQEDLVFQNPLNDGFIIVTSIVLRQVKRHRQITLENTRPVGFFCAREGGAISI
jgi:hypothetical protein